jgi:hypothetical protein
MGNQKKAKTRTHTRTKKGDYVKPSENREASGLTHCFVYASVRAQIDARTKTNLSDIRRVRPKTWKSENGKTCEEIIQEQLTIYLKTNSKEQGIIDNVLLAP